MTDWHIALPATILLIALSAFFVMIEFALLSVQRHRLEETVETSASSRAALRSLNDLTLMLAGAQLGITLCTFALGAITKPWVKYSLAPLFEALNLPQGVSDSASFIIALFLVTFLHLVVGEMAPKSWAIAHPESAVRLIALPARGFITIFRPFLVWINRVANALVARTGETPVNSAAAKGYDAATLQHLVADSHQEGNLGNEEAQQLSAVLDFEFLTLGKVVQEADNQLPSLNSSATVEQAQALAVSSQQLRILLTSSASAPTLVSIRDTVDADPQGPVAGFGRELMTLTSDVTLLDALKTIRSAQVQVAAVCDSTTGEHLGLVTWDYMINKLWAGSPQLAR